jgi:hypothetical protein
VTNDISPAVRLDQSSRPRTARVTQRLLAKCREFCLSAGPTPLFLAMVALTLNTVGLATLYLPMHPDAPRWGGPRGIPWLEGLCRWDAGWFVEIAVNGYWLEPGRQSPVAFFPLYPLLIRALAAVVGRYFLAGIVITMACGLGVVLLVNHWLRDRLDHREARMCLWILLLYPFSGFLFGAVYSDGLFLFSTLASFTCLERNRPWMAGLFGAAATAARPVGLAVVAGLVVRAVERRGVLGDPGRRRLRLNQLHAADAGVLISLAGMSLYCLFLWLRFNDPLAWIHAVAAPGWNVEPGPTAWFKVVLFTELFAARWNLAQTIRLIHVILCVIAYATIPAVWRRFGIGYAVYVFMVLSIPAVSSPDLFGAGRYVLPAFPCFAIVAVFLHERPRLARAVLPVSLLCQVVITALFATWYMVA